MKLCLMALRLMARPSPSRLPRRCRATDRALRSHRPLCSGRAFGSSAPRGGALCMARKSGARHRAPRFVLENSRYGARDPRPTMSLALVLARLIGVFSAPARTRFGLSFFRRTKGNACPSGLGEADGDGLLGRSGSMFAVTNFVDFFTNKFTRLCRWRLAGALVLACLLDCSLVRHIILPRRVSLHSRMPSNARGNQIDPYRRLNRSPHAWLVPALARCRIERTPLAFRAPWNFPAACGFRGQHRVRHGGLYWDVFAVTSVRTNCG